MNIGILSPAYPSAINGLGDYACEIGDVLQKNGYQIFYIGLVQSEPIVIPNYVSISPNAKSLIEVVEDYSLDLCFVNYSGYGYHLKGYPVWLVDAYDYVHKKKIPIISFFHELYASGQFYQPVFWYGKIQQSVFKRLYNLSTVVFNSNSIVQDLIISNTKDHGNKSKTIGMIGNIPHKPDYANNFIHKEPIAVIFGTKGRREAVYAKQDLLCAWIDKLGVKRIVDIGEAIDFDYQTLPVPVDKKGVLNKFEIGTIFKQVRYAFIEYDISLVGKSGVFASLLNYEVLTINLAGTIFPNYSYLYSDLQFTKNNLITNYTDGQLSTIVQNAFNWYKKTHEQHIANISNCISGYHNYA